MASFPSNIEIRNVIPYWRSFREAVRHGEVATLNKDAAIPVIPINTYIHDWNSLRTIAAGGDLLSAAIMNGQTQLPVVQEVSRFLLERPDEISSQLRSAAQRILYGKREVEVAKDSIEELLNNKDDLIRKIKLLKRYNSVYSLNPVSYVELASCYTQLGNVQKAQEMMDIAVRIAPNQRFVSRSAARLYMHLDDKDKAYYILSHNECIKKDPWLLASEIAVRTADGRVSSRIENGIRLLSSDIIPYELSELGSAVGTVEMLHGSRKKARQAISIATKSPNDNGFAQAVWWAKYYGENIEFSKQNILQLYEADSIEMLFQDEYDKSLSSAVKWLAQMPFSKRAALFASEVAYTYIKDYDVANKILKVGLQASPQDTMLLNNQAYSCALQGDVAQAARTLSILNAEMKKHDYNIREHVCYDATCGLTEYRKGNPERGAELYQKAIVQAIDSKDEKLANLAMLNYIREEVQYNPSFDASILGHLDELVCENQKEADQIKKDIRAIYKLKRES